MQLSMVMESAAPFACGEGITLASARERRVQRIDRVQLAVVERAAAYEKGRSEVLKVILDAMKLCTATRAEFT